MLKKFFTLIFLSSYLTFTPKTLTGHPIVKNKVINAQVKGKMLAIQELAKSDYCNEPATIQKIKCYQKQIEDLTNQKIFLRKEYRESLRKLRASR